MEIKIRLLDVEGISLPKVAPGVNFINVKRTKNSYERCISAAFSSYMYVEKRRSYEIFVRITLMKLATVVPPPPPPIGVGRHRQ